MKKLLLASVTLFALAGGAQAAQVTLPNNPTSVTGNFALTPGAAAFEDQVIFTLTGGPQFVTIANATNTFAAPADMIQNWVASIWSDGVDNIINNADDELLFGPQAATPCPGIPLCQGVGGSGLINSPGRYYAEFTGTGSGTSGYAGNISTFQVPGPVVGGLIPGMLAAFGMLGFSALRRRRNLTA